MTKTLPSLIENPGSLILFVKTKDWHLYCRELMKQTSTNTVKQ